MSRAERHPVTTPVEATLSPVLLRLFPYEEVERDGGTHLREPVIDERPWAWGALCRVTFHFDDLVMTKRITTRSTFWGPSTYPQVERPSEATLAQMRSDALRRLVDRINRHGIAIGLNDLELDPESQVA